MIPATDSELIAARDRRIAELLAKGSITQQQITSTVLGEFPSIPTTYPCVRERIRLMRLKPERCQGIAIPAATKTGGRTNWTSTMDQTLIRLWNTGTRTKHIADEMKMPSKAINARIKNLRKKLAATDPQYPKLRKRDKDIALRIIELHNQGLTHR